MPKNDVRSCEIFCFIYFANPILIYKRYHAVLKIKMSICFATICFLINFVIVLIFCDFYNMNISYFNIVLGKQWFHDRKLIGPTFHFSILEQFAVVQSEKAEILIKCLEKTIAKDSKKAINVFPFALNVALDIICGNVSYF